MSILLLLLSVLGVVAGVVVIARRILAPIEVTAKLMRRPSQFMMSDLACLLILVQIVFGLAHATLPDTVPLANWLVYGFGSVAVGLAWWVSVGKLSRAGIDGRGMRALFLLYVLPVTYFGGVAFMTVFVIGLVLLYGFVVDQDEHNGTPLIRIAVIESVLFVGFAVAEAITLKMGARTTGGLTEQRPNPPPAAP